MVRSLLFSFILILSTLGSSARADSLGFSSIIHWCEHVLSHPYSRVDLLMDAKTKDLFKSYFGKNPKLMDYLQLKKSDKKSKEFFWFLVSQLPQPILETLYLMPENIKDANVFIESLKDLSGTQQSSFLNVILRKAIEQKIIKDSQPLFASVPLLKKIKVQRNLEFSSWLDAGMKSAQKQQHLDPPHLNEMTQMWSVEHEQLQASNFWSYGFGKLTLLPDQQNGNKVIYTIRGHVVKGKIHVKDKTLLLQVPVELVRNDFENPIIPEKIQAMIGAGVPSPKVYQATLAPTGYFFLSDGNHRFKLDSRSSFVPIEVSYPLTTLDYRRLFIVYGLSQPTPEQILQMYKGQLDIMDLIPEDIKNELIYQP